MLLCHGKLQLAVVCDSLSLSSRSGWTNPPPPPPPPQQQGFSNGTCEDSLRGYVTAPHVHCHTSIVLSACCMSCVSTKCAVPHVDGPNNVSPQPTRNGVFRFVARRAQRRDELCALTFTTPPRLYVWRARLQYGEGGIRDIFTTLPSTPTPPKNRSVNHRVP